MEVFDVVDNFLSMSFMKEEFVFFYIIFFE